MEKDWSADISSRVEGLLPQRSHGLSGVEVEPRWDPNNLLPEKFRIGAGATFRNWY